jgi:hypothetical protein
MEVDSVGARLRTFPAGRTHGYLASRGSDVWERMTRAFG